MAGQTNLNQIALGSSSSGKPLLKRPFGGDSGEDADNMELDCADKRNRVSIDVQGLSSEMMKALNDQMDKLEIAISDSILKHKPSGQENLPWASEFKTERLFIGAPQSGINVEESMIDQLILALVQAVPTRVTITRGQSKDNMPVLSAEDERFLVGILSAIKAREAPKTLKTSSSNITDLTFYSVWNLAAARLVNDKDARGSLHPCILPDKPVRGGRASEYLSKRFLALKATLGLNYSHVVDTIERLIKLWTEERAKDTFELLSSIKIPWSFVLSKGGEFKVSKKKQGRTEVTVRQLVTPLNPKESAWVMPAERKIISHLCAPIWSRIDAYQKEWVKLAARDTHPVLDSYIGKVRLAYKEMHAVSESMTKRLGQRKTVILRSPEISRLSKKELKNKKTNDLLVIFSKTDLSALPRGAKAIFEPFYAGEVLPAVKGVLSKMATGMNVEWLAQNKAAVLSQCNADEKRATEWEFWWFENFKPPTDYSRTKDIPKDVLAASNMFAALSDEGDT